MKLKKGDNVIVITGKHKGAKGPIVRVMTEKGRVIVGGVNKTKRHLKSKGAGKPGSIVEVEASLNASNVMIVDAKTGTGTRIGIKKVADKNVRFAKKSGAELK